MSNYKVIDDLVKTCKNGQEYPDGSPERESGSTAGQLLVMAFRPLILATLSRSGIHDDQFEDAFQDGIIAESGSTASLTIPSNPIQPLTIRCRGDRA